MKRSTGKTISMASMAIALAVVFSGGRLYGDGRKIDGRAHVEEAVDNPNGEYHLQELNGQSYLKLSGRVGTLRIGKIDGQSTLDASCLDARAVVIEDKIDGQSDLIVRTSSLRFREINGQSIVLITHKGELTVQGGTMDGQSRLLHRGDVELQRKGGIQVNGNSRILRLCE